MDRLEHLQATYIKNIQDNTRYPNIEFVLLNYSCPNEKTEPWISDQLMQYINDGTLTYLYYPDADYFDPSHARNLSMLAASGDIVCNLDADNFTGPNFAIFVYKVLSHAPCYIRGPITYDVAGRVCMWKEHFLKVGGYDERMQGWGGEDGDITSRLRMLGLKHMTFNQPEFCRFIAHDDNERTRHMFEPDRNKPVAFKRNRMLLKENQAKKILRPNGERFGVGRVQRNFSDWLAIGQD